MVLSSKEFRKVFQQSTDEIMLKYPNVIIGHAGLKPNTDEKFRYDCTPNQTKPIVYFASKKIEQDYKQIHSQSKKYDSYK